MGCPPAGGGSYWRFWLVVRQNRPSAVQLEPEGILTTYDGLAKGSAARIAARSLALSPGSSVPSAAQKGSVESQGILGDQRRARTSATLDGMAWCPFR